MQPQRHYPKDLKQLSRHRPRDWKELVLAREQEQYMIRAQELGRPRDSSVRVLARGPEWAQQLVLAAD